VIQSYTQWIIKWRYAVVLTAFSIIIAAALGCRYLEFSSDYRIYFGKDNPQLLAFNKMQKAFNKNDNIFFVVTPKDKQVLTRKTLGIIKEITEDAWQIPFSSRVDSITNYQYSYAVNDDLIVDDLVVDPAKISDNSLQQVRAIATSEPDLINRLISPDAQFTGINVTLQLPGKSRNEVTKAVESAREIKAHFLQQYPEIELRLVGTTMLNEAFPAAARDDIKTLYPVALGFITLVLFLLLRGISGTISILVMILFCILAALGLGGWLGIKLSSPVVSAPVMILTMAIANGVHLLITMQHEMQGGMNKIDAMVESMCVNLYPIFITSLTTVIGFLSLNFSDSPPFHDLGNIAAMGVAFAFILSITLLPALVTILPSSTKHRVVGMNVMSRFGSFVIKHSNAILLIMGTASIILICMIPKNELNDLFIDYFDETIAFRRDSDYAAQNLTGVYYLSYALQADSAGDINEPRFLKQVDQFAYHLRSLPEVIHVQSITDTYKRLNKNLHGDDPTWYRLPDNRQLAAQYLLLYETSLPYGLDLNHQIDLDKRTTRIVATIKTLSSNEIIALENETQNWLETNLSNITAYVSGPTVMFAHIGKRNINSMVVGTSIALVLISFMLIFFLRSIKYGLISLIPNLLPAATAFGIWGLFVGQVGIALSIVTGMTLGIVVDDTVHFLSKYKRARHEKNYSAEQAVQYAVDSVGVALLVTSIVLIAGFMILSQSHFELNSGMGLLTSIVIVFALIADLLLLPPLLIKLDKQV